MSPAWIPGPRIWLAAAGAWLLLLAAAVVLGGAREAWLQPRMGEPAAHVLGTLAFLAVQWSLTAALVWLTGAWWQAWPQWIAVGAFWLGLTLAFEFGFFHYVMGHPWSRLLHDYNLAAGRLWSLVVLSDAVAPPLLAYWTRS